MHKKVFAYYYFMGLKHKKSWSHILTSMCSLNCFSFFINMNASVKPVWRMQTNIIMSQRKRLPINIVLNYLVLILHSVRTIPTIIENSCTVPGWNFPFIEFYSHYIFMCVPSCVPSYPSQMPRTFAVRHAGHKYLIISHFTIIMNVQ